MRKRLLNIVGPGNISDNPLDLEAYSYCASGPGTELTPNLIIWPQNPDQVRRIMLYANQTRIPVVIRGSGTSRVDGCIGENAIIVSSERMNKIIHLDLKNKIVEVEAGMTIKDLNDSLRKLKVFFPLIPFNPMTTIGGMIARNMATKESQQLKEMFNLVEEIEFIDGTGKYYYSKRKEDVVGKEGLSGFISRAKLRIIGMPVLSFDVFSFSQLLELLKKANTLKNDIEVYFLEFLDKRTAVEMGLENKYILIAAYTSLKGKGKEVLEVNKLLKMLASVHSSLRSRGYYYLQDSCVSLEKTYDLIEWCEKNNVRLRGHIGLGLFYAYFLKQDKDMVNTFRSFVRRINGRLGGVFGYGLVNKDFVNPVKKKELIKLKEEYDYNNILNPGKVIDYR